MRTLLFLCLYTALPALADEVIEYQFDVILFEDVAANQTWLSDATAREYLNRKRQSELDAAAEMHADDAIEDEDDGPVVFSSDDPAINFQQLEDGILDDSLAKLEASDRYRVIDRRVWKQSGFSDGDSIRIDIAADDPDAGAATGVLFDQGFVADQRPYLSGSVMFRFSRYIHLSTDLIKENPLQSPQTVLSSSAPLATSHISVERKLRSNETHYVDHPLLGIVIHIQRLKLEKAEG